MSEAAVSSLPVYNPRPTLRVNGREHSRLQALMLVMRFSEQEGGLGQMELRLSNFVSERGGDADYAFEDEAILKLGATLEVEAGDVTEPQALFKGWITGIEAQFPNEAPPEIIVYAEDKLQNFRMQRRTQIYKNMNPRQIAQQLAGEHGLSVDGQGLQSPSANWMQMNESDLAFLRRLCQRFDGDLQIVGDRLQLVTRADAQRNRINLELYSQLHSVSFFADLAQQRTRVSAAGWDYRSGQRVSGESRGTNLNPGSGRSGASILRNSMGERSEHVGHIAVHDNEEANALAQTVFDQNARGFVTADGVSEGNPRLRVGSHLQLSGISARFANTYYVVETEHLYDVHSGYETHFKAQCAYLGNV